MDMWTYGHMDMWTFRHMDIWTCGHMDIQTYGYMDIIETERRLGAWCSESLPGVSDNIFLNLKERNYDLKSKCTGTSEQYMCSMEPYLLLQNLNDYLLK